MCFVNYGGVYISRISLTIMCFVNYGGVYISRISLIIMFLLTMVVYIFPESV